MNQIAKARWTLLFLAALIVFPSRTLWGQQVEWIRQFGAEGSVTDFANTVDSDGNVYVAGIAFGTFPGQVSPGGVDLTDADAFVRKYDALGNEVWTRQFGSSDFDQANGVAVDGDGNVYVAGQADGPFPGQVSAGGAFVRKYDSLGNEVWTRQFGPARAFDVAVGASGVYVVGFGNLPGQVSAGSGDAFVRKYDALGNEVWTRQFGSSGFDQAFGVAVDAGHVYVTGEVRGTLPGQVSIGGAFVCKYDASGNEVWTRQFGSINSAIGFDVAVDAGDIYVAGLAFGTILGQVSAGDFDGFVRKYDALGNEVWTRQFGTSSFDKAIGVAVDAGGVYVAGETRGGTFPGQVNAGGTDAFVRKYDSLGNIVWTRQFGTTVFDRAEGVAVDASGVYVAGRTSGTFPGQVSSGGGDPFVRKYDALGTEVWTRQFGAAGPASDYASAVDSDGNVYVAGRTSGTFPGHVSAGQGDAFVRKYDGLGNEVWTRQFGSSSNDEVFGVAIDSDGSAYVAGQTGGVLPGQVSAGGPDAYVRKYDTMGNEVWTRQFGSFSTDWAFGIAVDSGGVYVAGFAAGPLPGQVTGGAFLRRYDALGNEVWTRQFDFSFAIGLAADASSIYIAGLTFGTLPGQVSAGGFDAFVRKYDALGTEIWTRQFGSTLNDEAFSIAAETGAVYVVGLIEGTSPTIPGLVNTGNGDAFVRKYDALGTEVWTRQFGSTSLDQANGVAVDASGVYVAGETLGALSGQISAGSKDAFVRKYDLLGTEVWTRQVGTSSSDQANGVSVDAGDVYLTGQTSGTLSGQLSSGFSDGFVIKYSQNRPPIADAGPDSTTECAGPSGTAVTLDGTGSSDPDIDPLTFAWFAPGITFDDPASPTPTGTFPLGITTVTLEVTDPSEESDLDAVDITVEDTTAPEIEAALMPVGGSGGDDDDDDDGGGGGNVFVVSVLGTDVCDSNPVETACIIQPLGPTDPFELKFKVKNGGEDDDDDGGGGNVKNEIKIKLKKNKIKVELKGPDQQFLEDLLNQAIQKGGFPVIDGQEVKLVATGGGDDDDDDDGGGGGTWKFVFDANGNLISASGLGPNLRAFATDASGNVSDILDVPVPKKGKGKHAKLAKIRTGRREGLDGIPDLLSGSPDVRFAMDSNEPLTFRLDQNFPNPFNPETTIRYAVVEASEVRLTIYNIQGQEVRVLINALHSAGLYNTRWDSRDSLGRLVASGIYIYRLEAGPHVAVRKMIFAK